MEHEDNPEYMAQCRAKLEDLGFALLQPTGLWASIDCVHLIDFSAIDPNKYVPFAMREMFNKGYADGEKHIKEEMDKLLGR